MIECRAPIRAGLLLLASLACGCSRTGEPRSPSRPIPSDRVTDFAVLYGQNCAGCHGKNGQFGPAPPIDDPTFLAIVPDSVLSKIVAEGRPGTPMPGFSRKKGGTLTDEQVRAIAEGMKVRWKAKSPATSPPSYLADSVGDASRGGQVFARACASCHGEGGLGGEGKVGSIHDPAFLALVSDQMIRRIVITGRLDLKMPDFAGKEGRAADFRPLNAEDVADVVAFVASWRRDPVAAR